MNRRGVRTTVAALAAVLFAAGCGDTSARRAIALRTKYSAVLLPDGQYFFGKLEDRGASFLMLKDVYYFRTGPNAEGAQTTRLVPRESDWHEPDWMLLSADQVVSIETVASDSELAKAIRRLKNE